MLKILSLLLWILASQASSQDNMQEVRDLAKRILPKDFDTWPAEKRSSWLEDKLTKTTASAEVYALHRALFRARLHKDEIKSAAELCMSMKMLPDDLGFRVLCLETAADIMPHDEVKGLLHEVLQDAKRLKRIDDAVDALNSLAWIQSQDGDIAEALASYAEALEIVPKDDERSRNNILFNLATNYIVHGNADYMRKGIGLLMEIKNGSAEKALKAKPEEADLLLKDSRLAAFNIGIAYTLHLHEYEKAIPEFEYAKSRNESNRVESLTFSALAAAQINQPQLAKKFIVEINGEESSNLVKEGYLKCYRALAVRQWEAHNSLKSCFELHPNTTLEVVSDINRRLSLLKGQPEEIEGLRAHMKMYEERIKPEYKKRGAKAASNTELKRLETEAKLKDEKIALGEKIKVLLYVVLMISFLLFGLMLIVLRSRRIIRAQARNIQTQTHKLQNVLHNIDEGIITIDRKACISPIYSRHVTQILKQDPAHLKLDELLALLGLESDTLASAHECFGAILGEELLAWELNEGLLPQSGFIHGAPFLYYWSPVVADGRITEVILSMRDASATLALQKEAHTRNRILAVVNAGVAGHNFIWTLDSRVENVAQHIHKEGAAHCLRLAHTIKGEARSFGFTELQDLLHNFEKSLLQDDFVQSKEIMASIREASLGLHEAYLLLKRDDRRAQGHPVMGLLQTVMTDAHKRLLEVGLDLASDINLSWVDLSKEEISALRDILVHGVANAIDHGYILPRSRNLACDQLARISVNLQLVGDDIQFSIIDGGIGIDWKALEEIARKRNWTPPKDADLADIVFMDKVSTVAEIQVNKTSGRGIGMAAVAEAVKTLDGTIKFGAGVNNHGARLDIRWKHRASLAKEPIKAAS